MGISKLATLGAILAVGLLLDSPARGQVNKGVFSYDGDTDSGYLKLRGDGDENVNNHTFKGKHDLFLSPRLFVTPLALEVFRDRFQNIELRATPAAGLGYTSSTARARGGWSCSRASSRRGWRAATTTARRGRRWRCCRT